MANVTVTFTITEFCLHTGISEEELNEIVGLGVVEPREIQETTWVFDDHAAIVVQRAVRLRHELALDWPGIAVALTLMDDIAHLKQENRLLRQRLSRFVAHRDVCLPDAMTHLNRSTKITVPVGRIRRSRRIRQLRHNA